MELNDGRLMLNMRTYDRARLRKVCLSRDGGATWEGGYDDPTLLEPPCQASILRYTWPENGGKSRILFANPASHKRENMTVRLSYDEGKTWAVAKSLWAGPAAYCCMAALPDGNVVLLFEAGNRHPYETIRLALSRCLG